MEIEDEIKIDLNAVEVELFQHKSSLLFGELRENDNITEIAINKVGLVFYEDHEGWKKGSDEQCARVTQTAIDDYIGLLASKVSQRQDTENPILSATMPTGERVEIVMPPACDSSQRLITVRIPSQKEITLEAFNDSGFFSEIVIGDHVSQTDLQLARHLMNKEYFEFFILAVVSGEKNIAVAGATGSGKTTFMKALISLIKADERLISIEDVRELISLRHENFLHLLYPSSGQGAITPAKLLRSCLRMKPDRIFLAELRGGETFDYINVISSGHGGSITSFHAGSYREAIRRLTLMSMQNEIGSKLPYETTKSIIEDTIDIVVCITNHGGKRRISSLYWKDFDKAKAALEGV
ncbi:TPA: P-type DNA transfer ATPase VirB11 [Yersinia enterocolitica]|nr:P-type DNA transfer ATPase VirB11 [Yersinia enterocolitica]